MIFPGITRPALRYHGGKWRIAPWVIDHFPPHLCYVEPFAGAASVLLRKPRSHVEIICDLDDEIVNFFRVLRDPDQATELERLLRLTPHARAEFQACQVRDTEPWSGIEVERARALVVRAFQSCGANPHDSKGSGWRSNRNTNMTRQQYGQEWANYPDQIHALTDRLRGVAIDNRPWQETLEIYDTKDTLFYLDPPYLPETRAPKHRRSEYNHEMTLSEHAQLAERLLSVRGYVVLSAYQNPTYDGILEGWTCVHKITRAQEASLRTETLYLSPRTALAINPRLL